MATLRPVPHTYAPDYPRRLTGEEVAALLRPSLFRRFSSATLLAGAVVTGAIAATLGARDAAAAEPEKSTRTDPKLKARVEAVVKEILGDPDDPKAPKTFKGFWYQHSSLASKTELASNPPVKYPHIPISFGNSYCGVFDAKAAQAATVKLFAEYGIELKADQPIKAEGYEFQADGYDAKNKVGFKIIVPAGREGLERPPAKANQLAPQPPTKEQALDETEQKALDADIKAGKLKFFVVNATGFPNMDNDQYTPLRYYLASVVDYLNYIHGDAQIDPKTVLGEKPPGKEPAERQP